VEPEDCTRPRLEGYSDKRTANTMAQATVILNLRTTAAKKEARDAIFAATREMFDKKILPLAKHLSPREATLRPGKVHNADSLEVRTKRTDKGVTATMFSQSGHGGYDEIGTSKMAAQPYMLPAFSANIGSLPAAVREKINAIGKK
jgi:HK97 gp10 family phage protein